MGSSYTPLKANGASPAQMGRAYALLQKKRVIEASQEAYFTARSSLPPISQVEEIEIGEDVNKSIVRFAGGDFVVFAGRIDFKAIIKLEASV